MAITNAQQAKQIMNEGRPMKKIKGQDHMLAYITPNEADKLVKLGGQETMTKEGIPAYPEFDNYTESSLAGTSSAGSGMSRSEFEGGAYSGTGNAGDGVIQQYNNQFKELEKKEAKAKEKKTILDTINTYNKNYKEKQKERYTLSKINELNKKLGNVGVDFFGDTEETYGDIIGANAPSVTDFGPEGTGKYSQEFIDDVLSGKRAPPESFSPIDISKVPGGLLTKGLATGANIIGKGMAGPTTKEELMDIYSGNKTGNSYIGARDLDVDKMTGKEMMEIFEPNRYAREYGLTEGGDGLQDPCKGPNPPAYCFTGIRSAAPEVEDDEDEGADLSRRFRADGGIMNTDVVGGEMDFESARQMYGLGKLVKKVTRSVKKIAKSPIGKAAIIGGLGYLTMGGSSGGISKFFGKGSFNPFKTLIPGVGKVSSPFGALASKFGITDLVTGSLTGPGKAVLGLGIPAALSGFLTPEQEEEAQLISDETGIDIAEIRANPDKYLGRRFRAEGGSMDEPVAKKTMPLLDMDGKEMDLRAEGGFVPIGRMEKADDVPARLSKNEFVFTADAVRNAGEGDVDKGAEVMYNMMKNLESGGDVSEESQGLEGARKMFQTSQRLEEVL